MRILPCKMCGTMPFEHEHSDSVSQECYGKNCGVRGPAADTREKSIAAWNALMSPYPEDTTRSDKSEEHFDAWWSQEGQYLDPDTDDVPWFDKRQGLAAFAFQAGMASGGNYTADDSTFPKQFTFANGRIVTVGPSDSGNPILFIERQS